MNSSLNPTSLLILGVPVNQTLIVGFVARFILALAVLVVGYVVIKLVQGGVKKGLEKIRHSKVFKQSPVAEYTKDAETVESFEHVLSEIVFWLLMLLVFDVAAGVAGITWLSTLFDRIISYLPSVLAASLIIIFGALLAGIVETLVKNAIKPIDARLSRLAGKVSSYLTMVLAVLIAISELGIAKEYILILFIGLIATLTLATGLAVGLGSQYFVKDVLDQWQKRWQDRSKPNS